MRITRSIGGTVARGFRTGTAAVWSGLFAVVLAGCQGDVTQPSADGTVSASLQGLFDVGFSATSFATTSGGQLIQPGSDPSTAGQAEVITFPNGAYTFLGSFELNSTDGIGGTVPSGASLVLAATVLPGCSFDSWRIGWWNGPVLTTSPSITFLPQDGATYIARVVCS